MKSYYLGIDTSCYTTSCAILDEEGRIIGEAKKLLEVKVGGRGLQQSNMVFQHTRALPSLIQKLPQVPIRAIGVSAFPRREEASYMPAFLVGRGLGESLSHLLQVPLYEFSHQENHILAALRSKQTIWTQPFYSLHVSGGTTDLLYCQYEGQGVFKTQYIGGSQDLHGGQFVDRIGVALGMPFPAGKHMERIANMAQSYNPLPSSVKHGLISFAGPCSEAMRRIEALGLGNVLRSSYESPSSDNLQDHVIPSDCSSMALSVFSCMGKSLEKMLDYHLQTHPVNHLIAVGGVMSNGYLRRILAEFCRHHHIELVLADPAHSVDNATGAAFGAAFLHKQMLGNC